MLVFDLNPTIKLKNEECMKMIRLVPIGIENNNNALQNYIQYQNKLIWCYCWMYSLFRNREIIYVYRYRFGHIFIIHFENAIFVLLYQLRTNYCN